MLCGAVRWVICVWFYIVVGSMRVDYMLFGSLCVRSVLWFYVAWFYVLASMSFGYIFLLVL